MSIGTDPKIVLTVDGESTAMAANSCRQAQHWLLSVAKGLEARIRLESIDCEHALAEVDERVL